MFNRPRPLTVAQQFINLRANPACAGEGKLRGNSLTWEFLVRPTPLSREYRARLAFRLNDSPHVFIDQPNLQVLAEGRRLPHVYQQRPTRLCLYLPGSYEWAPWMRIDRTIIPWTALWLLYFEEWLASDKWAGGGRHPEIRERGQRISRCRSTRLNQMS